MSKPSARAHPDDVLRLQTIRGQIEELEARNVEDMTNEYTIKVLQLEKSASFARELLDSIEKEVAEIPTKLADGKTRELDEARKNFSRLSSDAMESKNASTSIKSDMMALKRLRRDESQLLHSIFSDPDWNRNEVVRAYYDEINNIRGSLGILQDKVAHINTAKVYVEMAMRGAQACQEASGVSEALHLLSNSQQYIHKSEEAFAEIKQCIPDSLLENISASDQQAVALHAMNLYDACQHAHKCAIDAGHRVQEERAIEEEKLHEKERELINIQRDLVIGSA